MATSSPMKIFIGPTPITLTEEALLEYFSRFGNITGIDLVDMSPRPSTSSNYPNLQTNILVQLRFYMITFSEVTTREFFSELIKEWHTINNHLVQVHQVEVRPVAFQTIPSVTDEPISSSEKIYYESCKKYYEMTGKALITISNRDNIGSSSSRRVKFGIDQDYNEINLKEYINEFCRILNISIHDINIIKIQSGSILVEAEVKKGVDIQMVYNNISRAEAEEIMGKMKIFFCLFGDLACMEKNVEFRTNVKLNSDWNRIYYQGHTYWTGALNSHRDRGNKPYYCPIGWKRYSLFMEKRGTDNGRIGRCICYHGTKFQYGLAILLSGLKPANCAAHGAGVYVSPSINYASHPRYSEVKQISSEYQNIFSKSGKYIQFVLECRVHPNNIIAIKEETLRARNKNNPNMIDPNIKDDEIEWVVNIKHDGKEIIDFDDPNSTITCSGLMVRITDNHPSLLPESQWWHTSHLCANNNCCCLNTNLDDLKEQKKNGIISRPIFD